VIVAAELTWTGEAFESGVRVETDPEGRILRLWRDSDTEAPAPTHRLRGQALLPGFVNAHSHAFQRGLRGRGETFPAGAGSFWTWREAMYDLVSSLEAEPFRALCLQAFREMRAAGITTVGEFHYLHHSQPEVPDFAFDRIVLEAAAEAGLRTVLLQTFYKTGAIGKALEGGQRHFATPSPALYWQQMDALANRLAPHQTLGGVVHSLRAASLEDLAAIHQESRRRGLVFHIHVEEQRKEIEDALAYYGRTPMRLLQDILGTAEKVTAIHCTHTTPEDFAWFGGTGGTACLCPLTEGNLGDGLCNLIPFREAGGRVCLGSDSNNRISSLEEMRWLEYAQRLRTERRGVLRDEEGQLSKHLLYAATRDGARALGLETGEIAPGNWADFVAIALDAPDLAGARPETLLDALIFGASERVIAGTCVGGEWSDGG
jgi:formimidoylglutamate deiminase